MGEFDLMLSFVSILFGIGYSKLLNAVSYVFSKNEKTSILYQLFFVYTFAAGIVHFWGFTNAIGNQDYNFNYFLCDVSLACFFYALCAFVSPSNFETINSWKEYFLKIRSKIWLCQILMVINKMLLVQFTMKDEALMNEVISSLYSKTLKLWSGCLTLILAFFLTALPDSITFFNESTF